MMKVEKLREILNALPADARVVLVHEDYNEQTTQFYAISDDLYYDEVANEVQLYNNHVIRESDW